MNDDRDWLTTTEAAREFGVERQTITRWIRQGRLHARCLQVGKRPIYRIERRALADFARLYLKDL